MTDETRSRNRRFGAFAVLALGTALTFATLEPDFPRDQNLVFRLPRGDAEPVRLEAVFTPVGAARATQGFTLALRDTRTRDVRHRPRLPNGDYLVTVELTSTHSSAREPRVEIATTEVRRVTLSGQEMVIVLEGEDAR